MATNVSSMRPQPAPSGASRLASEVAATSPARDRSENPPGQPKPDQYRLSDQSVA